MKPSADYIDEKLKQLISLAKKRGYLATAEFLATNSESIKQAALVENADVKPKSDNHGYVYPLD